MASVQGDDAGCAESLGNCDEAAVGAAEVLIGLLVVSAAIRVQSAADSGSTRSRRTCRAWPELTARATDPSACRSPPSREPL
jgi:hypothetical protein